MGDIKNYNISHFYLLPLSCALSSALSVLYFELVFLLSVQY
jgi:hypothetical protein